MTAAIVSKRSQHTISLTYHLLRYHNHGFGCKSTIAVIEQVLEGGSKEVNDENVVQALLAKIVDIWDASWYASVQSSHASSCYTDGSQRGFCTSGTRPVIVVHRSSSVPVHPTNQLRSCVTRLHEHGTPRTNLMATCWLLSRLVPSKMTPNEPSPIFFPTL